MFKSKFYAFCAFGVIALGITVSLTSCDKNKANVEPTATVQATTQKAFDFPVMEIADDDQEGARTAAVANPMTYRIKHTGSCNADVALIYIDQSVSAATLADSSRGKKYYPNGGWKSFTIKAANLNKVLGKTLDKTKTYTFYVRDKTAKSSKKLETIAANPTAFQATETKVFSNSLYSWSICK